MLIDDRSLQISLFSPVCSRCIHFKAESVFGKRKTCAAFPIDGIPLEIWVGKNPHTQPFKGDNGIQFQPYSQGVSMYNLANPYDNSRLIIHRCIENAIASPITGVLEATLLPDGAIAGRFLDIKEKPFSYKLDSEVVYYAPMANSVRADSKGKKCPGGYWIPRKHKCKKATMTPSAQKSARKVKSSLGGNILAATLATAAVAGAGAATYSAKKSYESSKEIKQANERLNEAISNTKGVSGNSEKIKEVNKRLNEIEKKTKKGGGSFEEILASGKVPKLIVEVQKEKPPKEKESAIAKTFEKAFPELYHDPTDIAAGVLRTGVLTGAAVSPFVGGAVLLKKRLKEEDEEMNKAKEAGKEITRAEARKRVNSKNKVGQLENKIGDGASNMIKEQASNAINEIPVVKHVAKPVEATVNAGRATRVFVDKKIEEIEDERTRKELEKATMDEMRKTIDENNQRKKEAEKARK